MKRLDRSTMKCRVCRSGVKATYISKTTVGIASQLHFNCGSKMPITKTNDGSWDRSFTRWNTRQQVRFRHTISPCLLATVAVWSHRKWGRLAFDLALSAFADLVENGGELRLSNTHVSSEIIGEIWKLPSKKGRIAEPGVCTTNRVVWRQCKGNVFQFSPPRLYYRREREKYRETNVFQEMSEMRWIWSW
jgi:hypothetical protein